MSRTKSLPAEAQRLIEQPGRALERGCLGPLRADANSTALTWNAFMTDPEWLTARAETERNGPLLASLTNYILTPTSYSKTK